MADFLDFIDDDDDEEDENNAVEVNLKMDMLPELLANRPTSCGVCSTNVLLCT
jgi:hypothetical protein